MRSLMKVQQAPPPVQAALLSPEIVPSKVIQSRNGGSTSQSSASTSRVRRQLAGELNRLRRSQSTTRPRLPRVSMKRSRSPLGAAAVPDGSSAVTGQVSPPLVDGSGKRSRGSAQIDAARSPLHQGDVAVVPIYESGEEQVDGEEDRHDDDDCLDLLACLVHHLAGKNLEDLRIGHGGAERAALDQIEVLARQLRHHHAHGLRQDYEEEYLSASQPE